jgi:arginine decarboxylase
MRLYKDLIEQTFDFPNDEFKVVDNDLYFNEVPLMDIIGEYGTPLKLTYLPKIGEKVKLAKRLFKKAMKKHNYQGNYTYCYCTKSSHFRFVLEKAIDSGTHIETSSAYDIQIVKNLQRNGVIDKNTIVVCNGFKRPLYMQYVAEHINDGWTNIYPVIDNFEELDHYLENAQNKFKLGIRLAADEEPNFEFYTSRLGVRYNDIVNFYNKKIKNNDKAELRMLHYFIHTGIKDTAYYWSELSRFVYKYCELRKICPTLNSIDIGGGFPIKTSLGFEFDYDYMVDQIVQNIKWMCDKSHVPTPDIITEFGGFTVGESGALIYSVLGQKLQNDKELWYMIDGSFITHLPDSYGLNQKYIMLAINKWDEMYHKVSLGGLTCDSLDYYNSEAHSSEVFMPKIDGGNEPLYLGFFHTGAYQESIGGYGGLQHCLIPAPKHVLIDRNEEGEIVTQLFAPEQGFEPMMKLLGYD